MKFNVYKNDDGQVMLVAGSMSKKELLKHLKTFEDNGFEESETISIRFDKASEIQLTQLCGKVLKDWKHNAKVKDLKR